ncbi:MAG: beta-propeller domain-containing protein [Bacillota bacterium]|nr:beta-propeller domain-containing protein [Bacillota bacterium]
MKRLLKLTSLFIITSILLAFIQLPVTTAAAGVQTPLAEKNRLDNAVVLYVGSPLAIVNNMETQIDTNDSETQPVVKNNKVLVPIRFISEAFGAKVDYNSKTKEVGIKLNDQQVSLFPGDSSMRVNGKTIGLDEPSQIIGNKTFIPLRQVAEALGKKIFYDRGLIIISDIENIFDSEKEKGAIDALISRVNNLPVIGNADNLESLLQKAWNSVHGSLKTSSGNGAVREESNDKSTAAASAPASSDSLQSNSYFSSTNVQVQGVDEADIVKTDGQYIYRVAGQKLIITRAVPADNMQVAGTLTFDDSSFTPSEIYLNNDKMVVIGNTYGSIPVINPQIKNNISSQAYSNENSVKAIEYDITDKASVKKLKEVELEGNYISSRKIGSILYLIASRYINYYGVQNGTSLAPTYRDTAVSDSYKTVDYNDIRYIPGFLEPSYMSIAAIDLDKPQEKSDISTYLGTGSNIYASSQNLYVAFTRYSYSINKPQAVSSMPSRRPIIMPLYDETTMVYKFSLNGSKVTYLSKGEVPGTLLNQFSMDENGNYFRIATTGRKLTGNGTAVNTNNLYVLDETMNTAGKLEDIAPGEQIYSARFMGAKAYLVTYRSVDPFFVIDMKDPTKPEILGALKIPGYSNYLQPYDENHIIGFGKDTVEVSIDKSASGSNSTAAYYQGMKIALFDVSDVKDPKLMYSTIIGDRGTDSELLYDHRALLFSKDRNLLAFPIEVAEIKDKSKDKYDIPQYGEFVFQGAYVYSVDLQKGFVLKGKITHISDQEYKKSGYDWYDSDKNIKRILYIGDNLYTVSDNMIKANDINSMKEIGNIN